MQFKEPGWWSTRHHELETPSFWKMWLEEYACVCVVYVYPYVYVYVWACFYISLWGHLAGPCRENYLKKKLKETALFLLVTEVKVWV